jgi:hypothetical protein
MVPLPFLVIATMHDELLILLYIPIMSAASLSLLVYSVIDGRFQQSLDSFVDEKFTANPRYNDQ